MVFGQVIGILVKLQGLLESYKQSIPLLHSTHFKLQTPTSSILRNIVCLHQVSMVLFKGNIKEFFQASRRKEGTKVGRVLQEELKLLPLYAAPSISLSVISLPNLVDPNIFSSSILVRIMIGYMAYPGKGVFKRRFWWATVWLWKPRS